MAKAYVFEGPQGPETLADLFAGRSQLIVYHFMFGPDWKEGCVGCSFVSDHIDGPRQHWNSLTCTSSHLAGAAGRTGGLPEADGLGLQVAVGRFANDFNYDYGVSFYPAENRPGQANYNYELTEVPVEELSGVSVFCRDEAGRIFHVLRLRPWLRAAGGRLHVAGHDPQGAER